MSHELKPTTHEINTRHQEVFDNPAGLVSVTHSLGYAVLPLTESLTL